MKIVTDDQIDSLKELYEFLEFYADATSNIKSEDGLETDSEMIKRNLSKVYQIINSKDFSDNELLFGDKLKNVIYSIRKEAEESVDPNYKYCITDSSIECCYLTDDLSLAMEKAALMSKHNKSYYILAIFEDNDHSFKTKIIGRCHEGHYYEDDHRTFLHFIFIYKRVEGKVKKL